jgi:propanol-preferring alcohol dehydrogenase
MSDTTSTYNAIEVSPSGTLVAVQRPLVSPLGSHVRIRVEACGICHTDVGSVQPHPDTEHGVVPGHEVVGDIDAIGDSVTQWSVGDRVGVGFLGGHCGHCSACRHGDFVHCADQPKTGIDVDGGYAEYFTARETGLVAVPDELGSAAAAPLLCAGLTTYNALVRARSTPDRPSASRVSAALGTWESSTPTRWE